MSYQSYPKLAERVFRSPYWSMRDRGSATVEEVITAMSMRVPELEPYIRRIMKEWIDLPAIPEGVETLKCCKEHGVKLYALTNYADKEFAYACEQHDFFKLFDGFLVSGREHTIKPGLDIYRLLISRFGLDPERSLFIDDSLMNIEAALESGLQALHYNRDGKLREFFAK
jgi:putative hydrolase of the HAD superfamily